MLRSGSCVTRWPTCSRATIATGESWLLALTAPCWIALTGCSSDTSPDGSGAAGGVGGAGGTVATGGAAGSTATGFGGAAGGGAAAGGGTGGTGGGAGNDTLLVGFDTTTHGNGCWIDDSTSIHDYTWKAFRVQASASGTLSYFKMRAPNAPTGCSNDSGCWAIYEDAGVGTAVGELKAYGCFSDYDWVPIGIGDHVFQVTDTVTDLSVTAGTYYSIVFFSMAADTNNYAAAGCTVPVYGYRGRAQAQCVGTLDGMIAAIDSSFPPPPDGASYDAPVASYFMWGVWSSGG